ncbi:uncharacterized protein LOC113464494 [Ceratina calcarata]|uniref:Uncharacterized protein LOC113464494 n=1 Tax=Ceratina calcarata TaxID=156304 RepID=A0AAJ7S2W8_9HYME|nr:uncharacterized protein LOC113464494 [Ceratina calcarata]
MEESSDLTEEVETESTTSRNENGLCPDNVVADDEGKGASERTIECPYEPPSPSKTKDGVTGTKVKRKVRSTRKKLNAMISNTSLYFSDTDSEGELTTISAPVRSLSTTTEEPQGPTISITTDDTEPIEGMNILSPDDRSPSLRSFVDNLTDIDEIYPSDAENEQKETLKVGESSCQGDTDLEDFEGEDEVQSTIFVQPRSDIFCDYSGETVMTKEGDGPFSVEVRNKIYREEAPRNERGSTPDIVVVCNTDEEDMDVSGEEELDEACCTQKEFLEDLDVLTASLVVMRNVNKLENMLNVKDGSDDAVSDCHTDVEDVDN